MSEPKIYYRVITKEGDSAAFHLLDFTFIPESNFILALRWYNEKALVGPSAREIGALLKNIVIRKKNKELLENPGKVTFLNSKNNLSRLFG